jgi:spore coat protein U-like protein
MSSSSLARPAATVALLMMAMPVLAGSVTGILPISATVTGTCSVQSPGLNFGSLNAGEQRSAESSMSVRCSAGQAYRVTLDAGLHYDAGNRVRRMASSDGSYIPYYVFKVDTPNSFPSYWGDAGYAGTYADGDPLSRIGDGSDQLALIYGQIDYRGNPEARFPSGSYSDQLLITVHY